ncbi:hypothetical protein [Streptosporangium roseum]|uniref:Uncharacterized protein n=1 Tax=Streptosporangium roseum (strain ATCC 12428 / DSM 43021 / JCM 3005 / KCTC 9067 / NCIMB 10171 / NRRL 2505 / NI 9100) TaxID=479432 RepID=D2BBY8_STRRD|nr:hypothetical protein [Streptosporangium roseum]ACZ88011.1 hypothetical protein Sros_5242 [Streptosporangium roseum DSM 43021]
MSTDGYSVGWQSLRRESAVYRERHEHMAEVERELRQAFDRDRATLGNDMYGAAMAKGLPAIEQGIFTAAAAYLAELEATFGGLDTNAGTYERAEQPPGTEP